ncbi:peptide-binding protein [Enterobacter kobei]|uniref:peptide-binding protein n=1 Tax=Enterobacter kobei TaxID=208224 RepID=UPI003266F7AE
MTTLHDTILPDEAYLSQYLEEALEGRSEDDYVEEYLALLNSRLAGDLRCYRSFGPFWPAVKSLLVAGGYTIAGIEIDMPVASFYRYESDALTLIAATLYSMERFEGGNYYVAEHLLPTKPDIDEEVYPYYSDDTEIELRATNA